MAKASNRAYVVRTHKEGDSIDVVISKIRIVCEFPDVFPEELPGLSPDQEIEFTIEVFPDTALVSISPYCMELTELKELKVQLQYLLDHSFICPSILH
ncbi:zf-CCHC domain-containing protein/RVP_2 domain-containing protein [Gossypium australe]|uniref:Zf-CCHC domain-containing protein/RVP_2 domain-containing protein n=1 Tax=Gossypium australe TaxID=47621 RepID=A0A5B6VBT0_9ROSI|nr:zf-CCHC domain-containing protein/RVP_2 domain-containing protein [Gossypium australe]